MKNKIYLEIIVFILILFPEAISLSASSELYDSNGGVVTGSICDSEEYTYVQDTDVQYQYIVILDENNELLEMIPSNQKESTIEIPKGEDAIKIVAVDYNNGKYNISNVSPIEFSVLNCNSASSSQEIKKDKYSQKRLQATVDITDDKLTFTPPSDPSITNYSLNYQFLKEGRLKELDFSETNKQTINLNNNNVVQVQENYKKNGKNKENYYEIEITGNNYIIRNLSSFEIRQIHFKNFINFKIVAAIILLLLILIFIICIRRKAKRKYKKSLKATMDLKRRRNID